MYSESEVRDMAHAKILKAFIASKGISQRYIARKIHMKDGTLSNLLNGRSALKTETLEAVCAAMGTTPADFFAFKSYVTERSRG
jgi:transcriptional regulator with XRE-family HTH domain